jgi:hypothetical protein
MNSNSLKKLLAVVLTGLFLVSAGANAATKCPRGKVPDTEHPGKCKPKPQE